MLALIPSCQEVQEGRGRNVIANATYHITALCGGRGEESGPEDASGCESGGKADQRELITSRKENLFPVSLTHYTDKHYYVSDNYLNVR